MIAAVAMNNSTQPNHAAFTARSLLNSKPHLRPHRSRRTREAHCARHEQAFRKPYSTLPDLRIPFKKKTVPNDWCRYADGMLWNQACTLSANLRALSHHAFGTGNKKTGVRKA